jgi:hypothetical protein
MQIHEIPALSLLPSDVDERLGPPFLLVREAASAPDPEEVPGPRGLPGAPRTSIPTAVASLSRAASG